MSTSRLVFVLLVQVTLFLLFTTRLVVDGAYCSGSPEPGVRTNDLPILVESSLELVKSVPNGKLFYAGPPNARFPIIHVWGSAYEMGKAQGELIKEQVVLFVTRTMAYLLSSAVDSAPYKKVPPLILAKIIEKGIFAALDWNAEITAPFTPAAFYEELQGLADATGLDYQILLRLQMFPEITKASCSFFGAWGEATRDKQTYQLRALDYDTDGPFKDFPLVTIYHPESGNGNAFANVGWPGSIGMLTGYSSQDIAVSEIGVGYPDASFEQGYDVPETTPPEKVKGKPWMFVLRDMLQFSVSFDEAIGAVQAANRTCNLIIGVGSGKSGIVNGIEYSGYVAVPYGDSNLLPVNETWHPVIPNVVYNGMDWLCPSYTGVLGQQLALYASQGTIDAQVTVHNILPTVQTGNLHAAIYSLTDSSVYLSFCRSSTADQAEPEFAYERQFTRLDMKQIFDVARPV